MVVYAQFQPEGNITGAFDDKAGMSPSEKALASARSWSDERLVKECLNGSEEAWSALLQKYQNLIYSIPLKYGLSREDASDIFQQVCLKLLDALPALRKPRSLAAWLISVTSHGCFQWTGRERRFTELDTTDSRIPAAEEMPEGLLRRVEQEQILREAVSGITPRCRELIRMLFFEEPAVPYVEVAKKLGIAEGSIGFIRMRCLKRLRRELEAKHFV